jgi:pimeloyl-ACP methyl ester carboxylesterase
MPTLATDDGINLHYEETGSGTPIVFVHEFGGDHRSWEPQVRHFARRYRCIAYNARGYPPSDVPEDFERYSQARARDDIRCVLDALGLQRAHVVGLSMGAFATLHFGMTYGHRALSITVAGGGYGSHPAQYRQFQADSKKNAELIKREGMAAFVDAYGSGPQRVQLETKDPRGFAEYVRQFKEHSPLGAINTLLGVQCRRPSFYELTAEMDGAHGGAHAHHVGRRGRALHRGELADEAHHPDGSARAAAAQRARHQPRRAGALQPLAGGFLPPGGERSLEEARQALDRTVDLRPVWQAMSGTP